MNAAPPSSLVPPAARLNDRGTLASLWGILGVMVCAATVITIAQAHGASARWYLALLALMAAGMLAAWTLSRGLVGRQVFWLAFAGAVALRVVLVPSVPALSTDLYRYLWDGRVQATGINPYLYAPEDAELAFLRDEVVWPDINRKPRHTIYPAGAQLVFRSSETLGIRSPTSWKFLMAGADVVTVLMLGLLLRRRGLSSRHVLLYAWNPLPVLAASQAAHLDALVTPLLLAAVLAWHRDRPWSVGALIGAAGALKLYPLLALPALTRRPGGRMSWAMAPIAVGVVALSYLPYRSAGRLLGGYLSSGYLQEEGYESGSRFVLARLVGLGQTEAVAAVITVIAAWAVFSGRDAVDKGLALWGSALLLTTPYAWYALPLVAFAVIARSHPPEIGRLVWPVFSISLYAIYLLIFFGLRPVEPVTMRLVLVLATGGVLAVLAGARHREGSA